MYSVYVSVVGIYISIKCLIIFKCKLKYIKSNYLHIEHYLSIIKIQSY